MTRAPATSAILVARPLDARLATMVRRWYCPRQRDPGAASRRRPEDGQRAPASAAVADARAPCSHARRLAVHGVDDGALRRWSPPTARVSARPAATVPFERADAGLERVIFGAHAVDGPRSRAPSGAGGWRCRVGWPRESVAGSANIAISLDEAPERREDRRTHRALLHVHAAERARNPRARPFSREPEMPTTPERAASGEADGSRDSALSDMRLPARSSARPPSQVGLEGQPRRAAAHLDGRHRRRADARLLRPTRRSRRIGVELFSARDEPEAANLGQVRAMRLPGAAASRRAAPAAMRREEVAPAAHGAAARRNSFTMRSRRSSRGRRRSRSTTRTGLRRRRRPRCSPQHASPRRRASP